MIGTGFIGCEAAASLAMRGLRVTLVSDEHVPHMARLGEDVGQRISNWLVELGVRLQLGAGVDSLDGGLVRVPGNPPVEADVVLMASGVRPRGKLAEDAGLEIEKGRVLTDEHMRAERRRRVRGRRHRARHQRRRRAPAHRRALGRGAQPRQGRRAHRRRPGRRLGRGARLLLDDRREDDQVRRVGRRLRRLALRRAPRRRLHRLLRRDGKVVGVLTHERDEDYEAGRELVEQGKPLP